MHSINENYFSPCEKAALQRVFSQPPNLNYRRKHCIQIFSSKTINFRNNYKSLKVTIYLPGQYLQQLPSLRIGLLHDNGGQNRTVHDTMFFCTGKKIDMIQIRD